MAQSEAQLAVEKWWSQSQKHSINSNDALVTLVAKGFETILVFLSPASCNARIDRAITSLDSERKFALQFENKNFDIIRHLCFGLIESLQVLLEVKGKDIEEKNQTLVDDAPNASLTIVEPKEELIDPIDQLLEGIQLPVVDDFMGDSLFKEEDIDFEFGVNNAAALINVSLNELPSNDQDSHGNIVESDMMGDDINCMEDPTLDYRNSTPIEENLLNNQMSGGEKLDESVHNEIIGEPIDSMEEEEEKDGTVHQTSGITKDPSETHGLEQKMRPKRTSSKCAKYSESLDESETVEKKPRIQSEKKIDNRKRGVRATKINHAELECSKCEYRSRSVNAWYIHLRSIHSTNPREMGLALLCDCGNESFNPEHSVKCHISKITVVHKNATPKCVMCEVYPKTAYGYAHHLQVCHKTTLTQKQLFLICSCGYKVRSDNSDPEHTKKCNGHEYTLHKMDEE